MGAAEANVSRISSLRLTIASKASSATQVVSCQYQNRSGRALDELVIALTASASFHGSESARAAASTSHSCLVCLIPVLNGLKLEQRLGVSYPFTWPVTWGVQAGAPTPTQSHAQIRALIQMGGTHPPLTAMDPAAEATGLVLPSHRYWHLPGPPAPNDTKIHCKSYR